MDMLRKPFAPLLVALLCLFIVIGASASASAHTPALPRGVSTIDWNAERQVIDGFGGSFAFHKGGSIMRLDEPVRTQILDMIFSREKGIGLSIVRNVIGDGGIEEWGDPHYDGPSETIMPEPDKFVWDDEDWDKDSFDRYQIWIMNEAKKRGVRTFFSTAWSPPAWMKKNRSVIDTGGDPPNKLDESMYRKYAEYLAAYVKGYKEHFGIDITHISPANEPEVSTRYSSCLWTPEELNLFVRDYLAPTFKEKGVPAKIVLGESMKFSEEYALPALTDPKTAPAVDVVAAHAYQGLLAGDTMPDPDAFARSKELGKTIWQTEYMNQGEAKQTFAHNTIEDGLKYATLIGNMFDVTGVSAYFWWWPAANNGADGSDLIRLSNDGSDQRVAPTENNLFRVFKRYYAFGNYSRFIRPGYKRIEANKHPAEDVLVTAYKDPKTGNFAVVAVNNSPKPQTVTFYLKGFPKNVHSVVPYRTSASENLKKLDAVKVKKHRFTVNLREKSVTTFIPMQFELPALPELKDVFSTYYPHENDGQSGIRLKNTPEGKAAVPLKDGSYIRYTRVNFADGSADGQAHMRGILSMHARVASRGGGTIEVRLDHPGGKKVGTMRVPKGKGADKRFTVSTMIDTNEKDGAYGIHDLYLVFKGGKRHEGPLFDVSRFEFSDEIVE